MIKISIHGMRNQDDKNKIVNHAQFFSAFNLSYETPFLIGLSGGADSVALFYLLLEQGHRNLILCHFDHQLRGAESDEDALFVKNLATTLQLPFELGTEDVALRAASKKISLEMAAREARYEFFAQMARLYQTNTLVLAHHADDQVETCFLHFLRGTGSAGLAGMLPISQRIIDGIELTIIRPLLAKTKKDLVSFLMERNLNWREDKSNASLLPTRNRLRHHVLPLLDKMIGPHYRSAITRTASILAAEDDYLELLAAPHSMHAELRTENLNSMPLALQRRVIHAWLRHHHFSEISFDEVERVRSLLNLDGPAKVNLPGNAHARRRAGRLFLEQHPV